MPRLPWYGGAPRIIPGALLAAVAAVAGVVSASPAYGQPAGQGYAEPAAVAQTYPVPAHDQLAPLRAEQAWQYATGADVVVAVLDSGVDASHPDLADRVLPGEDFVDGSTDGRTDSVGHGTTVASLVAGRGADEVFGLAPDAMILPVRVLDDENRYQSASTVADGVVWAVDQGAQVINLSLGGDRPSTALSEALAYAMTNDVVVVACTGNVTGERDAQVWYPAREPGVIGVAGLDWTEDGSPSGWSESLTGPETVLAAPAVVTGAQAGGGYRAVQGTSFSAALVAGSAALIRSRWPELPAADVVNRLVATAHDLGEPGRDPVFGFGAVDPVAALVEPVTPVPTNPLDTKARHGTSGFGPAPDRSSEVVTVEPAPDQTRAAFDLAPGHRAGGGLDDPPASPTRSGPPPGVLTGLVSGVATGGALVSLLLLARLRRGFGARRG